MSFWVKLDTNQLKLKLEQDQCTKITEDMNSERVHSMSRLQCIYVVLNKQTKLRRGEWDKNSFLYREWYIQFVISELIANKCRMNGCIMILPPDFKCWQIKSGGSNTLFQQTRANMQEICFCMGMVYLLLHQYFSLCTA